MSIIIQGMEMPKNCWTCPFNYDFISCEAGAGATGDVPDDERLQNCPLIELPPHGDLIDRDEYEVFSYTGTEGRPDTFDDGVMFMLDRLSDATVIIPREEKT